MKHITLVLNEGQAKTISMALEHHSKDLKDHIKGHKEVSEEIETLLRPTIFEMEMLAAWIDREINNLKEQERYEKGGS